MTPDERAPIAPSRPDAGSSGSSGPSYHGHETWRLANDHLWVDVLASAGPRIVRLGQTGSSENLLAETPDAGWETANGRYELFGGHRLWFAPEDAELVAVPDGHGLHVEPLPNEIRLTGSAEPSTGLVRSIALRLAPDRASLEVRHELRNGGEIPLELAPWPITQLPLGGTVLLPQAAASAGHDVTPNRTLVLWPYTSWEDPRFRPRDGLILLRADAGPSLKVGYLNRAGWVAYARGGSALVRRFEPQPGLGHPDLGCNVEVFIGGRFVELELLGPLTRLAPGATVSLAEHWDVVSVDLAVDPSVDPSVDLPVDESALRSLADRIGAAGPRAGVR